MNTELRYTWINPVRLNGQGLGEIDPRIKVTSVTESAPKLELTTSTRGPYDGLRLTRRVRRSRQISIKVKLWEKDKSERARLYDQLAAWADGGGLLTLGRREGQRIRTWCEKLPELRGDDWQSEMEIGLIAYDPYWESEDALEVSYTAAAGVAMSKQLRPGGTAERTLLEMEIVPTAAMDGLTASVGGRQWALTGLGISAYGKLVIDYDEHGFLRMMSGGASKLGCRSAQSHDDLWLMQRQSNTVTVTTDAVALVTLRTREKWL